jgi:regulator of PEP synthase PpsR (kinase-PPPase family)
VDEESVRDEILEARKFFTRKGWPVIDVSRRSIEETAASILNHYSHRQMHPEKTVAPKQVES